MMDGKHLVAALVLAVAISGCTALPFGGDGGEDDGPDLRATPDDGLSVEVRSLADTYGEGEEIAVRAGIANTGQATARDIVAQLYGPLFMNPENCGEMRRGAGSALAGVDESVGQDGEETAVEWTCSNPIDLPAGEREEVTTGAAVTYEYTTNATASFTLVPRADFEGSSSPVSTSNTNAPVKAEVDLSSPVTVTAPREVDDTGPAFNVTAVYVDPSGPSVTFEFLHPIDDGDFNLDGDLSRFGVESPSDRISLDSSSPTIDNRNVTFPLTVDSGNLAGTTIEAGTTRGRSDVENTVNELVITTVDCRVEAGDGVTRSQDCDSTDGDNSFYWEGLRIVEEGGGVVAKMRLSQDVGNFRGTMDGWDIENATSGQPSKALSVAGSLSANGNVMTVDLELNDSYTVDDLEGEEFDLRFGTVVGPRFELVSAETREYGYVGTCTAEFGADWQRDEYGIRDRSCVMHTRTGEEVVSGDFNVPVTVRNVGDGEVADIDEEPQTVAFTASLPNAPDGVELVECNGVSASEFPINLDLLEGERTLSCGLGLPDEVFETQLEMRVGLTYRYFETAEDTFTVEGAP